MSRQFEMIKLSQLVLVVGGTKELNILKRSPSLF
jgi:hypothetical protein